jgi:hypothetical protein
MAWDFRYHMFDSTDMSMAGKCIAGFACAVALIGMGFALDEAV